MNLQTHYRFGSLSDLAAHLRHRATEIKLINRETLIDKARVRSRADAYEEIADMLDNATIEAPRKGKTDA